LIPLGRWPEAGGGFSRAARGNDEGEYEYFRVITRPRCIVALRGRQHKDFSQTHKEDLSSEPNKENKIRVDKVKVRSKKLSFGTHL
jgi:hypothetical protein